MNKKSESREQHWNNMNNKEENLQQINSHQTTLKDTSTIETNNTDSKETLKREMKFHHAFAFVVGGVIGAGIFVTPSLIARRTPNLFTSLLTWLIAGMMSLTSALCYCEMTAIVKKTGGSYVFILDCYGPAAGFIVNWTNILLFGPCDACILLSTIGLYTCAPFFDDHNSQEYLWASKGVGIVFMLLLAGISSLGAKKSGAFQIAFTVIQMAVFATIFGLGVFSLVTTNAIEHFSPSVVFNNTMASFVSELPSFGIAIFDALYCFDGYIIIAFIVEEVVNPSRAVPLLSLTSIPFVTFVYILINLACGSVLTHEEIANSQVFLFDVAKKIGGDTLSYLVPFAVAISVVPGLAAVFFNLPRLMMSAAREGQFPAFFSLIHKDRRTPIPAILFFTIQTIVLTLISLDMQTMLQICNITIWFEYAFAISTVLINRWRRPNIHRTYKTWITTPIVMVIVPMILLVLTIIEKTTSTLLIIMLMALSLPIYYVCFKQQWISSKLNIYIYNRLAEHTPLLKCKISEDE